MTEHEKEQANSDEGPTDFDKWKEAMNHDRIFNRDQFCINSRKEK